jgi:Fe-S cluster assembly ATP-binding protein
MSAEQNSFIIRNLHAETDGTAILKGVDLSMTLGETHALMGPNGSGKSTLANVIMGHPAYEVTEGEILFRGQNLLELEPEERARLGVFLAFQYPVAIPGVSVAKFLKSAHDATHGEAKLKPAEFLKELRENIRYLEVDDSFINRYLNDGFSGGEKKRLEIMQMHLLEPRMSLLDETDSGLDIDALKVVSDGVNQATNKDTGVLLVTHYQRILDYVKPDVVHVFMNGRIARTGGPELAHELEERGYDWLAEGVTARAGG